MKGHWWFLTLSWLDDDQGTFLTAHDILFIKNEKNHRFIVIDFLILKSILLNCFMYSLF